MGNPHADLVEAGWTVSVNTVADSMRRQGQQGRKPKRRKGTAKQDKTAPKFPDRLRRDFTAPEALKWCGDMAEIPTDEGKLYLATVLDLVSRKLPASPTAEPSGYGTGRRCDQDGCRRARRTHYDRWGDLPYRSRINLHGKGFHETVPRGRRRAVDGQGRVVFRQPL